MYVQSCCFDHYTYCFLKLSTSSLYLLNLPNLSLVWKRPLSDWELVKISTIYGKTLPSWHDLRSKSSIKFTSTGADLGGGCRGCAPLPPSPYNWYSAKKKKNYVFYWCWKSWIRPCKHIPGWLILKPNPDKVWSGSCSSFWVYR